MEDEREEEVSSLSAIYSDSIDEQSVILALDSEKPYALDFTLSITPEQPTIVQYVVANLPTPPHSDDGEKHDPAFIPVQDQHTLDHLPPIHLTISLPVGYPSDNAPQVKLSTTPDWLGKEKTCELEHECQKLWEEYGQCQIIYSYVSFLQDASERLFDLETPLMLSLLLKPEMLDFNRKKLRAVFEKGTFDCGVCLEPKKGTKCYRLTKCGHVFCLECLRDYYNGAITEGDVVNVTCINPTCGKDNAPGAVRKRKKKKTLHPSELLDMGIEETQVRRYVELKRKKRLESDKSTIYCPRPWCQAPARNNKTAPIPKDLRQYQDSSDSENESSAPTVFTKDTPDSKLPAPSDRLAICSNLKCQLAFCRVCYSGWHGEFARCWPRNPTELSAEDKASYDYILLHTSPCPTCSSPTSKTMGCNHMNCFQCNTHFCYLCGAWLDAGNPYQHFNKKGSACYQRLWEMEEGDNADGQAPDGPRRWEQMALEAAQEADREEAERLQAEENRRAAEVRLPAVPAAETDDARDAQLQRAIFDAARAAQNPRLVDGMARLGVNDARPAPAQGNARRGQRQRQRQNQAARPAAGRAVNVPNVQQNQQQQLDPAHEAAFRRFVEMAARDEEDGWDSDELEDDDMWIIRPR